MATVKPPVTDVAKELKESLDELVTADSLNIAVESDLPLPATVTTAPEGENAMDPERARERARKQREKGLRNLKKRHSGVVSVVEKVELNERVVGSAFERFFATMENGIYVVMRRGEMLIGEEATKAILDTIDERLKSAIQDAVGELEGIKTQLSMNQEREGWMIPQYISPASSHEVQLRSPRAVKLLELIRMKDKIISAMQMLAWNGEMELSKIEDAEFRLKKDLRNIHQFITGSIRGMRNKAEAAVNKLDQKTA